MLLSGRIKLCLVKSVSLLLVCVSMRRPAAPTCNVLVLSLNFINYITFELNIGSPGETSSLTVFPKS